MRYSLFLTLLVLSINSSSQTVITRPYIRVPVRWITETSEYDWDTKNKKLNSPNPLIILSFDEITIIDGDTTKIFLNETPESEEDSTTIEKKWYESNDMNFRECSVFLFYFKEENEYSLRILYSDDNRGYEYYMKPLRVDVIPFKNNFLK